MPEAEILAKLDVAPARRWVAIFVIAGLSILMIALAAEPSTKLTSKLIFAMVGALVGWGALRLHAATRHSVILTETELVTTSGEVLCQVEDIIRVERGAFAFKPSGGFTLKLARKAPAGWAPGLWWKFKRTVGIGGVTNAGAAKAMADIILVKISERS